MKKIILTVILSTFSLFGYVNDAEASSLSIFCNVKGKIINVSDEYIYFSVTKVNIFEKNSSHCSNIKIGGEYRFENQIFFRNTSAYRANLLAGHNLVINRMYQVTMGPNGVVSGEEWELDSAGDTSTKIGINIEKIDSEEKTKIKDVSANLIEGRTYTIKELKSNTSISTRRFKTEGYLVRAQNINDCPKCPRGAMCNILCQNTARFSETNYSDKSVEWDDRSLDSKTMQAVLVKESGIDNAGSLKLGAKYYLDINVKNFGSVSEPRNQFEVVHIAQSQGGNTQLITTSTSSTTDEQLVKKSFIARFASWFWSLVGRK